MAVDDDASVISATDSEESAEQSDGMRQGQLDCDTSGPARQPGTVVVLCPGRVASETAP